MNRAHRVWRASFTRRWHSNPDLSDTTDYVAGHQGRVALLVSVLKPDASRTLLLHAITHDQGEGSTGDLPYPFKASAPSHVMSYVEAAEGAEMAVQFPGLANLTDKEARVLKLCDWLDAWLWVMRFARHLYATPTWQEQLLRIKNLAWQCELGAEVEGLIDAETTRG